MTGNNWIGRVNAPTVPPAGCSACETRTPHTHGAPPLGQPAGDTAAVPGPYEHRGAYATTAPTYDRLDLERFVTGLGDLAMGGVEQLLATQGPRPVLYVVGQAIGHLERLSTHPGDAGDALRALSDLAVATQERAADSAGPSPSPGPAAAMSAGAAPDPLSRRAWRTLGALRWPAAFAVGTAGFELAVYLGWSAW